MSVDNEHLAKSITLCDAIDRLLNKGVVVTGDITVSVAGVDLLYIVVLAWSEFMIHMTCFAGY